MRATTTTRGTAGRYRGPDRRTGRFPGVDDDNVTPRSPLPALLLLALIGIVAVTLPHAPAAERFFPDMQRVCVAAGALEIVAGIELLMRWRLDGHAFGWWAGLALVVVAVPDLALTITDPSLMALCLSAAVVSTLLFVAGVRSPEVDSALDRRRAVVTLMIAVLVTFMLGVVIALFGPVESAVTCVLAAATAAAAIMGARAPLADHGISAAFACYAFALGATALAPEPAKAGAFALLHVVAGVVATIAAVSGLQRVAQRQGRFAYAAQLHAAQAQASAEEAEAHLAETIHEVRSTVVALEGGIRTLRPNDADDPLTDALSAELKRLGRLVDRRPLSAEAQCSVHDALQPLLTVCARGGWPVEWAIPEDVHVYGGAADVAQIVHALVTNARKHAPGSKIQVGARRHDEHVDIYVDDDGPGVPRHARETIFDRGMRASRPATEGSGLGLHIARRIARELGGELSAQSRGGGARFVLTLRAAAPPIIELERNAS